MRKVLIAGIVLASTVVAASPAHAATQYRARCRVADTGDYDGGRAYGRWRNDENAAKASAIHVAFDRELYARLADDGSWLLTRVSDGTFVGYRNVSCTVRTRTR